MSREHNHAAFKKWAEERLEDMRRRACIFCGYPTRHTSQTCPAHRDLAPSIYDAIFDEEPPAEVQSRDDTASGMGGTGVVEPLAPDPGDAARLVDRGSA